MEVLIVKEKHQLPIVIGLSFLILFVSATDVFFFLRQRKNSQDLTKPSFALTTNFRKPKKVSVEDKKNNQIKILGDQTVMEWKVFSKTASPSPIPQPVTSSNDLYEKYGIQYNVKPETLREIAWCESQFRADAVNGPYAGLFQFSSGTWVTTRVAMGLDSNPDLRFNADESIKTAAFKISQGGLSLWPNCSKGLSP